MWRIWLYQAIRRAATIISALQDGRLYFTPDQALLIKGDDDSYTNAATGEPVADAGFGVKPVRLNNSVRGAIDAALGSLRLFDPNASVRLDAAEAVFNSHDPAAIPALDRALAKETDASVKRRMEQARAAAVLSDPARHRMPVWPRSGSCARGGIRRHAACFQRLPDKADRSLMRRARRLCRSTMCCRSGVLRRASIMASAWDLCCCWRQPGLAITFGVMGVINMAHGEMVMIGAYVTFVVQQLMHAYLPSLYAISLLIAVPMAFLVSGLVGVVVERSLIRWLYGRPLETLLATWGLSLVLQQVVRSLFGANNRDVDTPGWMSGATQLGGLTLTWNRMYIILFAFLVVAALMAALRYTPLGLRMRAVTQNRRMAAAMGIRTPWIDAMTFGLGSGVAGIAGVALSQIDNVSPNLGQGYIIDSFMVVVFGGVGNLWGTTLGALTLGIVNKFLEPVAGAVLGKIVVLVLLILFVQRNPRGMFPLKGRAVEA